MAELSPDLITQELRRRGVEPPAMIPDGGYQPPVEIPSFTKPPPIGRPTILKELQRRGVQVPAAPPIDLGPAVQPTLPAAKGVDPMVAAPPAPPAQPPATLDAPTLNLPPTREDILGELGRRGLAPSGKATGPIPAPAAVATAPGPWSKEALRAAASRGGPGEFGKGLATGAVGSNVGIAGSTLRALGVITDNAGMISAGDEIERSGSRLSQSFAPRVRDVRDIKSLGDAVDYAMAGAGQAVGSTGMPLAAGALGGLAGGPLGALAGAGGASYIQNLGDTYQEVRGMTAPLHARAETGRAGRTVSRKDEAIFSAMGALPVAALDMVPVERLLGPAFAPAKKELQTTLARIAVRTLVVQGGIEMFTEGAQQALEIWTGKYLNGEGMAFTRDQWFEIINNALPGLAGGAVMGGVAGGLEHMRDQQAAESVPAAGRQEPTLDPRAAQELARKKELGAGEPRLDGGRFSRYDRVRNGDTIEVYGIDAAGERWHLYNEPAVSRETFLPQSTPPGQGGGPAAAEQSLRDHLAAVEGPAPAGGRANLGPSLLPPPPGGPEEATPPQGPENTPPVVTGPADVVAAGSRAATSPLNDLPEPTAEQKKAESFRTGDMTWRGIPLQIENPKGTIRSGKDAGGKPWSTTMPADYGRIRGTKAADGSPLDFYMGPQPNAQTVYVVDQIDPKTGDFDEHKAMLGFPTQGDALRAYQRAFDSAGALRIGAVTPVLLPEFKAWIAEPTHEEPLGDISAAQELIRQPVPDSSTEVQPGTAASPETIVAAAIKTRDGRVFTGQTHPDAMLKAEAAGVTTPDLSLDSSGFTTSTGRFVDRREAVKIVEAGPQTARIEQNRFGPFVIAQGTTDAPAPHPKLRPVERPQSLAEFLASRGGVRNEGGELSYIGADQWHRDKRFRRRLMTEDGLTIGHAREIAEEARYLAPGSADRILIEKLDEELRGKPVYPHGVAPEATQAEQDREELDFASRIAEELGQDVAAWSPAKIKDFVRQAQRDGLVVEATDAVDDAVDKYTRQVLAGIHDANLRKDAADAFDIPFDEIGQDQGQAGPAGPGAAGAGDQRALERPQPAAEPGRPGGPGERPGGGDERDRLPPAGDGGQHQPGAQARPALVAAVRDENGAVHYGSPGEIHADIVGRMGDDNLSSRRFDENLVNRWESGFARPGGPFLTREQAGGIQAKDLPGSGFEGLQSIIPGAERITDRELAERKIAEPKRGAGAQQAPDEGLFDLSGRGQIDLVQQAQQAAATTDFPTAAVALPAALPPEETPTRPSDVLATRGLVLTKTTTPNGKQVWEVTGRTFEVKETLKSLGGRYYKPKNAWSFYDGDPSEDLASALVPPQVDVAQPGAAAGTGAQPAPRRPSGRGAGQPRSHKSVDEAALLDARRRADASPDQRPSGQDARNAVAPDTVALLERGRQFGIPDAVIRDQVEDAGLIKLAYQAKKPLFILASEAGTGKTFVLGAAIREMRRAGAQRVVYLTMNSRLIDQIKTDLAPFDVGDVEFATYQDLSLNKAPKVDRDTVVIWDEAHTVLNATSSRGQEAQRMIGLSGFNVFASATPAENPVDMEYMAATGLFDDLGGFLPFAKMHGAASRKAKSGPGGGVEETLYWAGGKQEDVLAARSWVQRKGVMTQRNKMIDPAMTDVEFRQTPASPEMAAHYVAVETAFDDALTGGEDADRLTIAMLGMMKINTLKRLLEGAKLDQAIERARTHAAEGKQVIVFVETKADRLIGNRVPYEDMLQAMEEWRQEKEAAFMMGEKAPKAPYTTAQMLIAEQFDKKGINIELPSTVDEVVRSFGRQQVSVYTGANKYDTFNLTDSQANRDLDEFQAGRRPILVATMAKGGTGLSLHPVRAGNPRVQLGLNLPWKAKGVDQVTGRTARYGLQSKVMAEWLFAPNLAMEALLAQRVGARMRDMGALVKGIDVTMANALVDWNFEDGVNVTQRHDPGQVASPSAGLEKQTVDDLYQRAADLEAKREVGKGGPSYPLVALMTRLAGLGQGDVVWTWQKNTDFGRFLSNDNAFLERDKLRGGESIDAVMLYGITTGRDLDRAMTALRPGGRLLMLVDEKLFADDVEGSVLRRMFRELGARTVKLPAPTGRQQRLVVVDKGARGAGEDLTVEGVHFISQAEDFLAKRKPSAVMGSVGREATPQEQIMRGRRLISQLLETQGRTVPSEPLQFPMPIERVGRGFVDLVWGQATGGGIAHALHERLQGGHGFPGMPMDEAKALILKVPRILLTGELGPWYRDNRAIRRNITSKADNQTVVVDLSYGQTRRPFVQTTFPGYVPVPPTGAGHRQIIGMRLPAGFGAVAGEIGDIDPTVREELTRQIEHIIATIAPQARSRVVDRINLGLGMEDVVERSGGKPGASLAGAYDPLVDLILVALAADHPGINALHEAVHHLRRQGLFTDREWSILARAAMNWRGGLPEPGEKFTMDEILEEAVAYKLERMLFQREPVHGIAGQLMARLLDFFERLRNWLHGHGYQSIEDILQRVESGAVGRRDKRGRPALNLADQESGDGFSVMGAVVKPPKTPALQTSLANTVGLYHHPSIDQRFRQALRDVRNHGRQAITQGMADQFHSIGFYDRNLPGGRSSPVDDPWMASQRTQALQGQMAVMLRRGPLRYDAAEGAVMIEPTYADGTLSRGYFEMLEPIARQGLLDELIGWMAAQRAVDLMAQGREHNYTQADIDEQLPLGSIHNGSGPIHPEFAVFFEEWRKFIDRMLDFGEQTGVIDPSKRASWSEIHWVPFYRVMDATLRGHGQEVIGPKGRRGIEGQHSPIRRLIGRNARVNDIIENSIQFLAMLTDASNKNLAMQKLVTRVMDPAVPVDEQPFTRIGSLRGAPALVTMSSVESAMLSAGLPVGTLTSTQRHEILRVMQLVAPKGSDIVSYMEGGRSRYLRVKPGHELLLAAIQSLQPESDGAVMRALMFGRSTKTRVITSMPPFMVANFMRDSWDAWVKVPHLNGISQITLMGPTANAVRAFQMQPEIWEIMAAGASTGGFYTLGMKNPRRWIENRGPHKGFGRIIDNVEKAWALYERLGWAGENANRLASYRNMRARGHKIAEAAHWSNDLMPFNMRGQWQAMRFLVKTVAFLNARAQGIYRLGRAVRENPMIVVRRGMLMAAASVVLHLINRDNPCYAELPEWDRDSYWHFFIPKELVGLGHEARPSDPCSGYEHFKLPKPFEIGAVFGNLPERAIDLALDGDMDRFARAAFWNLENQFAFIPIPTLTIPIIEQIFNYNTFTGAPIWPDNRKVIPRLESQPWTSPTVQDIAAAMPGEQTNWWLNSPAHLQSLMNGYLGDVAKFGLIGADALQRAAGLAPVLPTKRWEDVPVVGRFYEASPLKHTRWMDDFYRVRDQVETLVTSMKTMRKAGDLVDAAEFAKKHPIALRPGMQNQIDVIDTHLRGLRKQMRAVYGAPGSQLTADQKRARIDEIQTQMNAWARKVKPIYDRLRADGPRAIPATEDATP